MPVAPTSANAPSTSAGPSQQATYCDVTRRRSGTQAERPNQQSALQPPAMYKRVPEKSQAPKAIQKELKQCEISGLPSFDPYARGASTTGDYYSVASCLLASDKGYRTATEGREYFTATPSLDTRTKHKTLSFSDDPSRPLASSTQKKSFAKKSLSLGPEVGPSGDTPNAIHKQTLAEAITSAMSKGLEPLLAAKEVKNKPTKYRGTRDGIIYGWLMLMKRYLEKVHAKNNPLDRAWTIVEFLENEARDYITNKSEAERDTDEKLFALLARRFGTGSNKIQIQQQFRTRNQLNDEDYMQYLDTLEGLRSQGFPNEEVTVRRYEIMQRFIEGVRNFELKRNLALMYAQEQYVETPPTIEALRFTVQQYLRMRGPARSENFPSQNFPGQLQQQQHAPVNQQNQMPAAPNPAHNAPQPQQQPAAYRPQPQRACFNCGDPSHFVADCPLKDRARKPVQQQVNTCNINPTGSWTCH